MARIPEDAKKMFNGIIFDVYHFDVELFDGSKATFEKLKRATTLVTIPLVGDKIVLVKDSQPHRDTMWGIPGGRQDNGESELDGAKRELLEETGYSSHDWRELRRYSPYAKIDWEIVIHVAHDCKKTNEAIDDPGEKIETHLVSFDKFIDIVCSPEFHEKEFALEVLRLARKGELEKLKMEIFGN